MRWIDPVGDADRQAFSRFPENLPAALEPLVRRCLEPIRTTAGSARAT